MNPDLEAVLLVPGLWMPALAMGPLGRMLAARGHAVHRFGYRSVLRGLDENVERLRLHILALDAARIHLVGHSLGGLLALAASQGTARAGRVVMVGSPFVDTLAGRRLACVRPGRFLLGRTLRDWLARERPQVADGREVGVIAGTRAVGLGAVIAPLARPHDGVVTVAETTLPGATDSLLLRVTHLEMMFSPAVAAAASCFIRRGSFAAVREGADA